MYEEDFVKRLTELRLAKKVSARDMSLSIGQSPNYINNIETGKALPSMSVFLSICDYLGITPSEFFNTSVAKPERMRNIIKRLENLSIRKFDNIAAVIEDLTE